jgi:hypothetical protein
MFSVPLFSAESDTGVTKANPVTSTIIKIVFIKRSWVITPYIKERSNKNAAHKTTIP